MSDPIIEPQTVHGYLPVLNQDILVPFDYWQTGAEVPPKAVGPRQRRLYDYRRLYEGESGLVADAGQFPLSYSYRNWFAEIADFYRDLLMNTPPSLEGQDEVMEMANDALRIGLINLLTHGVMGLRATMEYGPEARIESVDPMHLYPAENEGDYVLLKPVGGGQVEVHYLTDTVNLAVTFDLKGNRQQTVRLVEVPIWRVG